MTGASSSTCSRCGAPIRWSKTATGKWLPLDPEPSTSPLQGNFTLRDGVAVYIHDGERACSFDADGNPRAGSEPVFIAHFATCTAR